MEIVTISQWICLDFQPTNNWPPYSHFYFTAQYKFILVCTVCVSLSFSLFVFLSPSNLFILCILCVLYAQAHMNPTKWFAMLFPIFCSASIWFLVDFLWLLTHCWEIKSESHSTISLNSSVLPTKKNKFESLSIVRYSFFGLIDVTTKKYAIEKWQMNERQQYLFHLISKAKVEKRKFMHFQNFCGKNAISLISNKIKNHKSSRVCVCDVRVLIRLQSEIDH